MLNTLEDRLGGRVLDSLISETEHLLYVMDSHQNAVGMQKVYDMAKDDIVNRYDVSGQELDYLILYTGGYVSR